MYISSNKNLFVMPDDLTSDAACVGSSKMPTPGYSRLLLIFVASGYLSACAQTPATPMGSATLSGITSPPSRVAPPPNIIVGMASWYGPGFEGRKTATGETFHEQGLTAASTAVPLGSRVKVTNLSNGRSVRVRINDCGPFVEGRRIDLSKRAADRLSITRSGVKPVRIEVLETPPNSRTCVARPSSHRKRMRTRPHVSRYQEWV